MANDRAVLRRFGAGRDVLTLGAGGVPWRDAYHRLLTMPWSRFFALVVAGYAAVNALFALGYTSLGDAIEAAEPGSFRDAFFFSVQTLATIGYGKMAPRGVGANLLVAAEALVGMLGLAVTTGLVYGRFARPTARVLFSRLAVVRLFDGVPSLMFRMANARGNQVAEARVQVTLVRDELTAEGEAVRRVLPLRLRRSESAVFALTWTVVHPIDGESPLRGEDAASLAARATDLVVSLTGIDEGFSQTIHARHAYASGEIRFGARLADILDTRPDGTRIIDYRRFHEVEPLAPSPGEGAPRPGNP
jgi:inward rectifier potassium channel